MQRFAILIALALFIVGLAACQTTPPHDATPTLSSGGLAQAATPIPTAIVMPSATSTLLPSDTPTHTPSATYTPTVTHTPSTTHTPMPSATPTITPTLPPSATPTITPTLPPSRQPLFVLQRPIGPDRVDYVDRTYPYGGTQFGEREVHIGVEFVNQRFTPILAAAEGIVLYAGDDAEVIFGPEANYYGNLVVLEHATLTTRRGEPLYTLYGHLQRLEVETGESVRAGQRLGQVGDSGIAIGPHLHFEVRVGDAYDYRTTRNPELYLQPFANHGTLVGYASVEGAPPPEIMTIFVRDEAAMRETYTYGSDRVNSDPDWRENFIMGDLRAGTYEVIVSDIYGRSYFRQQIDIRPGQVTWLDVTVDGRWLNRPRPTPRSDS